MIIEFVLGCISLIILWFLFANFNGKNQPPGPIKLPFFGNLLQMSKIDPVKAHVALHKLSLRYGPIMSIRMGWRDTIVLGGYKEMKDLLSRDECSGRVYDSYLLDRSLGKETGVVFTNGETWRKVRSFTVRALREFGFGKTQSMESFLEIEANHLVDSTLKKMKENSGVVEISERFFHMGVLNSLWGMVAGVRYEWDDPQLQRLLDINDRAFEVGNFGASLSFSYPALRFIFPETFSYNIQKEIYTELRDYMRGLYVERKRCEEYKTAPQNVVDAFLKEADKESNNTNPIFNEDQFVLVALDLFQAGGETTAGLLGYSLMMMVTFPEVQRRIHEEIDSVCPIGTSLSLSLQNKMPYTQAAFLEMMRFCHILPLAPPRKFTEDCHYNGYTFKKNTTLMVNIYSASMDQSYWKDPENFRPERFIKDGKFVSDENVAVFGFGKRACLGDSLAKATLFLFFVSMLQNFQLERVKGEPLPNQEPICCFTMRPQTFNAYIKKRV